MVADGMGGAAAGDLASAVAVQTMQRLDTTPPDDMLEALAGAVHRANDRLAELIEEDPAVEGMGTTVTAVLFDGARIGVAHLGDSRGYLWRDGELLRITHDHTWVQSLIDEGRITEDEAGCTRTARCCSRCSTAGTTTTPTSPSTTCRRATAS